MTPIEQHVDQMIEVYERMGGLMLGHAVLPLFVKEAGQVFVGRPLPDSYERGEPRQCFMNATTLVAAHPSELTYCEGLAYAGCGIPTLHAWCIDRDGLVVDTTWERPAEASYYGITVTSDVLLEWTYKNDVYGLLDMGMGYNQEFMDSVIPGFFNRLEELSKRPPSIDLPPGFTTV